MFFFCFQSNGERNKTKQNNQVYVYKLMNITREKFSLRALAGRRKRKSAEGVLAYFSGRRQINETKRNERKLNRSLTSVHSYCGYSLRGHRGHKKDNPPQRYTGYGPTSALQKNAMKKDQEKNIQTDQIGTVCRGNRARKTTKEINIWTGFEEIGLEKEPNRQKSQI